MTVFGNDREGFELIVDRVSKTLIWKAWGFWSFRLGKTCEQELRSFFFGQAGDNWRLLADLSAFMPQRPDINVLMGQAIRNIICGHVDRMFVVVTDAVARMQVWKMLQKSGIDNWSFFAGYEEAEQALLHS